MNEIRPKRADGRLREKRANSVENARMANFRDMAGRRRSARRPGDPLRSQNGQNPWSAHIFSVSSRSMSRSAFKWPRSQSASQA